MIKDNEIQAEESPFKSIKGEKKIFDGYDGYVSINQVVSKIQRDHLGEMEYDILKIVSKYEFVTSRQINQLLSKQGYEINNTKKLSRKLDQMLKGKLLSRCYFSTFDEKSAYKVYSLEKNGKYLLDARNIISEWKATDNTKLVGSLKRRLAANQMIIAHVLKNKSYVSDESKFEIISKQYNRKLFTKGIIHFNNKELKKKMNVLVESVRRDQEDDFLVRFKIYSEFFKIDSNAKNTELIIICEDKKHIVEVYKELLLNKIDIPNIYFTYDLIQLEDKLEESLFQFEIKDKELDLKNVIIDIWKTK